MEISFFHFFSEVSGFRNTFSQRRKMIYSNDVLDLNIEIIRDQNSLIVHFVTVTGTMQ